MLINSANLTGLRDGFQTSFQEGMGQAEAQHGRVATTVNSTNAQEKYGWMGKLPNVREWLGPRAVQNLMEHDYTIRNKAFELTIGVDRDDISDDNLGIYSPLFREMGMSVGAHPSTQVYGLMAAGFATLCYDGQNYFDTDHPVIDQDGNTVSVANTDGGSGTPWYLIDSSRALLPIIYQERKPFEFVAMDNPNDQNVFTNKEFEYGVDGRNNVGFGFWQIAWGSKQTLDKANYKTARAALSGMKGDHGRPLGLKPNLLIVPPALESEGRKLLNSEFSTGTETNEWKGTAELLVVPWLAQ